MKNYNDTSPGLEKLFDITILVDKPILIGKDDSIGRRQLVPILSGEVKGERFSGEVLPGGIDSQIIRPDGTCELSARCGIRLDDGATIYIENNGIRTVPEQYVQEVIAGGFVDPSVYYFRTTPKFETYDNKYKWLMENIFVCYATRLPYAVLIEFYRVR